jgi:L-alanine-DL-glutamate epimerase-like enolase superfamily enzyme
VARLNPAAKAAVDMAAYDLLGQRHGLPVWALLGADSALAPRTSFTIGIDTPERMAQKTQAALAHLYPTYDAATGSGPATPILKVKVGTPRDGENLQAIRRVAPHAVIRVDANGAWTAKEAIAAIRELETFGLEFVEQPCAAADLEGLRLVRERAHLPILADESCVVATDVPRAAPCVDGINIKLMKCGGIFPALQLIFAARAHGLRTMLGCMIESSVAITAAAHLSPFVDYADLDGHLLVVDDPFAGVAVQDGRLVLPTVPGLGVRRAAGGAP